MQGLSEALSKMTDPEAMWELYTQTLKEISTQHVQAKAIKPRHPSAPEWFNKKAKKIKENIEKQSSLKIILTMNPIENQGEKESRN